MNREDNCPNDPSKHTSSLEDHFVVSLEQDPTMKAAAWAVAMNGTEIRQMAWSNVTSLFIGECRLSLNPKVDTPLFATNANPLQLYYSPRAKILVFNGGNHNYLFKLLTDTQHKLVFTLLRIGQKHVGDMQWLGF